MISFLWECMVISLKVAIGGFCWSLIPIIIAGIIYIIFAIIETVIVKKM